MRSVGREMRNCRAAIEWSLDNDVELGLRLGAGLGDYWSRIASTEGERLLDAALARAGDDVPATLRARGWLARSRLFPLEPERGQDAAKKSLALFERIGDDRGVAAALAQLSHFARMNDEPERSTRLAEAVLARAQRAGDGALISEALTLLSVFREDIDDMLRTGEAAERLLVEHGRIDRQAQLVNSLAYGCIRRDAAATAPPLARRALAIAEQRDDPLTLGATLGTAGLAALFNGDETTAELAFRRELQIATDLRIAPLISEALHGFGALAGARHDDERAAVLRGAGATMDRHPDPVVDDGLERWFTPCRERLGDDRWGELVQQGGRLSVEEAVARATGDAAISAPT
jgi:hypothetical protein